MRRTISILAAAIAASMSSITLAQDNSVTVVAVPPLEAAMRGTGIKGGGDALAEFEKAGTKVGFNIQTGPGIIEVFPRLGTLSRTSEDVMLVSQLMATPRITSFLVPLDDYLSADAIPGFPEDWLQAAVELGKIDGKHYLVPFRCGAWILGGNRKYLAELGITEAPRTPEELYEIAKKATFTKPNGEKVYGFSVHGRSDQIPSGLAIVAAMFGGAIIDRDGKVVVNSPETVQGAQYLRKLYVEGIMPPNWTNADTVEMFRSGRLSITATNNDHFTSRSFEAPDALGAGGTMPFHVPILDSLRKDGVDYAPGISYSWGAAILAGADGKDNAYKFLKYLADTSTEATMMGNRNQACRINTLAKLGETDEAVKIGLETFMISRPPLPAHVRIAEASDAVSIATQEIVMNGVDAQSRLDALADELKGIYE